MPASRDELLRASLLDLRDELAVANQLVVASWLACQAPHLPDPERRALCGLANVVRERLESCLATLDRLIAVSMAEASVIPVRPSNRRGSR